MMTGLSPSDWILLATGALPGVAGLVGVLYGFGRLHQEVTTIRDWVEVIPKMSEDIAYLRGRMDGTTDNVAILQDHALKNHRRPRATPARAVPKS